MQQSSIALVICYFGKFNNYFPLWLHSCKYNPTIDWIIFTDDQSDFFYPPNVKVYYTTFDEIATKFRSAYNFEIALDNPYKLCEFKVTYGEIFSVYLKNYSFWGYCDNDTLWGNLRHFITEDILNRHSKISWRGHLTLFRNTSYINSLYKRSFENQSLFQLAFENPTQIQFAFDERGINEIFKEAGEQVYMGLPFADLRIRNSNFHLLHFAESEEFKNIYQIFYWKEGKLYRIYVHKEKIWMEEFAYIHFLKRPMKVEVSLDNLTDFYIVPNKFIWLNENLNPTIIKKLSKEKIYFSYYIARMNYQYIKIKYKHRKDLKKFKNLYGSLSNKIFKTCIPPLNSSEYNLD